VKTPNATVLLIDDEDRLLLGLAAMMRRAGYAAHTAVNGAQGLQLAREVHPDVIVCDVMMPPPDGFQLRQILAKDPVTASIPFIFLTARTGLVDKLRGIEGGADDYVTKPFDRAELLARVQAVLRRADLERGRGRAEAEAQMDKLRARMLESVSLEMQSPVAALLSSLRGVMVGRFGSEPQRLVEFVEAAMDSASRVESMVGDLVTLAALHGSERVPVRLAVSLDQDVLGPVEICLDHWRRFELRDVDLELSVEHGAVIQAQPGAFQRALFHLVDNAMKFSPEGGKVAVDVRANGVGGCMVDVVDEGPGIPKGERESVFECFHQGNHVLASRQPGLGVGLTIARALARSLGGDVTVLDSPRGCHMRLVIPPRATVESAA